MDRVSFIYRLAASSSSVRGGIMAKGFLGKRTVHEGNAGGT